MTSLDKAVTRATAVADPTRDSGWDWSPVTVARDPRNPRRGLHPLLLTLPPAGNLADAFTTRRNLSTGRFREANPIIAPIAGSDALLYGTKLGLGLLTSYAADQFARRGHRNFGKVIAIFGGVAPFGFAAHNELLRRRTGGA